jgi:glycerol kinase
MSPYLLAIDAGTTGVTAMLFDSGSSPVARAYREFSQHFPRPGWVEHEASSILQAVDETLAELALTPMWADVAAIGITNQRETIFALELRAGRAGRALGTGIVWLDRRTAERCAELKKEGHEDRVRAISGLVLDPYFSATKIEWMLRHREAVAPAADAGNLRFVTVDALIIDHLTAGAALATEPTNASRSLLFDIDGRCWSEELCSLFGVESAWLPPVLPSTAEFGRVRLPGGREVPIHGVAGDQQAALFGQGCVEAGSFKNTYGTGCFLVLNTGERRVDSARGLLTTLAVGGKGEAVYALEGSVFAGGLVVQWLRDGLGIVERASETEALARSVEDSGGVVLVPAFAGLGVPWWDADARAALLGLTRGSTRAHIARAALESIALQCADVVELLREETGLPIDSLRVDGGAAANDLLMQLQADLAGLEVLRPRELESTARGAAALAALGIGLPFETSAPSAEDEQSFEPRLEAAARQAWLETWHAAVHRVLTKD